MYFGSSVGEQGPFHSIKTWPSLPCVVVSRLKVSAGGDSEGGLKSKGMKKKGSGPRRQPAQERSRETVKVIVQAAAEVLILEGYEKATTNKIAARAGISIGSLYHYFPNKEAVFKALIDYAIDETTQYVIRRGLPLTKEATLEDVVRGLVRLSVTLLEKYEVYGRAILTGIPSVNQISALQTVEERIVRLLPLLKMKELDELRLRKGKRFDAAVYLAFTMGSAAIVRITLQKPEHVLREDMIDELTDLLVSQLKTVAA